MRSTLDVLVAGITALALMLAPAAANLTKAEAAPPEKKVVDMSTGERVARIAGGAGLVVAGVLPTAIGGYVATGAVYGALAAIGIGATAAPVIVGALVVTAIGFGTYHLVKGILGKKVVEGPAGVNAGRNDPTTSRPGSPGRPGRTTGGSEGAGTPR